MSRFPSMPLMVDAYLADTTHLTAEEHGAYLLLLMAMWRRNGWVPDDDRDLARICHVSPKRWSRIKARLLPLLIAKDGELSQGRLIRLIGRLQYLKTNPAKKSASDRYAKSNNINDLDHISRARDQNQNQNIKETPLYPPKGGRQSRGKIRQESRSEYYARRAKEVAAKENGHDNDTRTEHGCVEPGDRGGETPGLEHSWQTAVEKPH